jgi:uncharacterized OB-fold protein
MTMTGGTGLVLPTITDLNRPFWDGCARGELRLQACNRCGHIRYPIAPVCPRCLAEEYDWRTLSGRGEILSWVYYHQRYNKAWGERLPYNVILVQLEEGPRMFSNALPLGRDDLEVGMPVVVDFVDEQGIAVPRFRPVAERRRESP